MMTEEKEKAYQFSGFKEEREEAALTFGFLWVRN